MNTDHTIFSRTDSSDSSNSSYPGHRAERVLTAADRILGVIFRVFFTAVWTLCVISGGIVGLFAVGAAVIFLTVSVFANLKHRAVY